MMNGARNEPMLKAIGLWEQTSNKVKRSLTGRLGGMKVLMLENRDRQSDDDPSHHLFFVEAPDRRQERGDAARAPQTAQRPSEPQRRSFPAQGPLDHNDAPEWAR
jgi:hypothetical protein